MTARVVDFATARASRPRLVAAIEDRAEIRRTWERSAAEETSRRERAFWLRDLDAWPAAFRRRVRPEIEEAASPENVTTGDRGWGCPRRPVCGAAGFHERRGKAAEGRRQARTFYRELANTLSDLRDAAARARLTRRRSGPPDSAGKLEASKAFLLVFLWSRDLRKIDRAELRPIAQGLREESIATWRHQLERSLARLPRLREEAADHINRRGSRKGQPLSRGTIRSREKMVRVCEGWIERDTEGLVRAEAQPDPFRLPYHYIAPLYALRRTLR